MLNCRIPRIAATGLLSLCWTFFVYSQDGVNKPSAIDKTPPVESVPAASAAQSALAPSASKVEEVRPSVFYLPDKHGNLQAVLDFNYEDFVELYKLKQRIDERDVRPRSSIQRMSITGPAGTENADLTVQFQITLGDGDWVRVPLRLDQALLREPAQYQGPGECFVLFDGEGEGYVAWIRGKKEGPHQITLKMLVPLSVAGEETKLKLFTPRAAASEMKLTVPQGDAVAAVSEGAALLQPAAAEGGTLFTALGLGGEFQLAWHKAGAPAAEVPAVLEAAVNILVRMDSQGITGEATLSVHSFASPFDRFVVRLPAGAELVPASAPGYSILPLEGKKESAVGQALVEVRLHKKTTGPVEIHLSPRRNFGPEPPTDGFDLAGFEVLQAARQWGTIAVAVSSDRQVVWGPQTGVRQTDLLPESMHGEGIVAGFEYSACPYTLMAGLAPRKTRINVDPQYVLLVGQDRIELEAKLSCFIRGAKIYALRLSMSDWEIDEAGPENLAAQDGIDRDESGTVSIPLRQPSSGKLELSFRAHKMLGKSAAGFSVALPVPQVPSPGPAILAVVPADNVELTPDEDSIQGLTRRQIAPPMKLPERRQDALYYRGEGKNAVFAARMSVHPLRVAPDAANHVHLETDSAKVTQKFAYTTVIERAWIQTRISSSVRQDRAVFQFTGNRKELLFQLPNGAAPEQMLVMLDGKRVEAQEAGENRFSLALPGEGEIRLHLIELSYHFPGPRPAQGFLSLDFPRLGSNVWTRRMYWQLVLPQNEHVLIDPPGFDREYCWKWCGYFWGREPVLNQMQLETWIGASQHSMLPEGASVYLYSNLGSADRAEPRTVGRTFIVAVASGAALILGLVLIYVPIVRHPFSLLPISLGLLSLAMIYPEPAAMIAQASGLGLALTLLAGILERSMARRRKKSLLKEPPKSIMDSTSSRGLIQSAPPVSAGSSTRAIPAVSQSPPQEPSP